MSLESKYQALLIDKLLELFPECFIIKNDPNYLQGVPDILILYKDRWAMLEVKASAKADEQPNQRYYVELLDRMSFAAFIYPENEKDVLNDLQQALQPSRTARASKR